MAQDPFYYRARAIEERRIALASTDPAVRRSHLELAAQYALRAGAGTADTTNDEGEERRSA